MTDAQWKVKLEQVSSDSRYKYRAFRKECVTQGIVTFGREDGSSFITVRYRDRYVATLFLGKKTDKAILLAVWNTIYTAEETIKKIEGVKHESN